jgi:hypothetical protein
VPSGAEELYRGECRNNPNRRLAKEPVKTTRIIPVSEKVFISEDLRRIAEIFKRQSLLTKVSGHNASTEYQIRFEDKTTLETDSPELFTDESLVSTSRPVGIRMSFHNFSLNRHIVLSIEHGDSPYHTNSAQITAEEQAWLSENFLALKEALDKVRPQVFWFGRHRAISEFLIAIGIGTSIDLATTLLVHVLGGQFKGSLPQGLVSFMQFVDAWPKFFFFGLRWLFYGLTFFIPATLVYDWLKSAWPSIEFDFGSVHLRKELNKRRRLSLVATLVIVPVAITLTLDAAKALYH